MATRVKQPPKTKIVDGQRIDLKTNQPYVGGGSNFNPTTTSPAPTPVVDSSASINRYPRYTEPTPSYAPPMRTQDQIEQDMIQGAQGEINSINSYASSLLAEQAVVNQKNDRSTSSISTLTGLAGSTEANNQQQATTAQGQKANQAILAEAQMKIQTTLGKIKQSAITEARSLREEARLSEQDRITNRAARQKEVTEELTNLSASGVTFEGLKKGDKKSYDYFVKQYGSEDALKGAFILNTPQDQIIDKKLEGGKYMVARQNPVTGKITIDTMDTGLPVGYSKTIDAGDRILAIPDDWDGDVTKLKTINKGLTPAQGEKAGGGGGGANALGEFPADIQAAAQSILDGKSKLNEYPSAKRLQINAAMSKVYTAEGGNELAQGAYDSAVALESHAGFSRAVGTNFTLGFFKNIPGSAAAGFLAELDKLKANVKLVNIKYLKGTGALSDAEGKTLENAGTSLSPNLPEADFKKELKRVKDALEKANNVKVTDDSSSEEQQLLDAGYTQEQIDALKAE